MSPKIIAALLIALSSAAATAQTAPQVVAPKEVPQILPSAPERHVVVPGDTLWGIAAKFLKDPWRWSEVWKLNASEVKNPHRIYPGQVIVLDRSGSTPRLTLLTTEKLLPRIREESGRQAIPAIPQKAIEPFLTRPLVLDESAVDATLRVVGVQDGHFMAGAGDQVYAFGNPGTVLNWQIYRPGNALIDPDTKEELGREVVLLGTAKMLKPGDPSTLRIIATKGEINNGDRLIPLPKGDIVSYPQHIATKPIAGRILTIDGGAPDAGRYSVVSVSRGRRDGLEIGHVLALYRPGDQFKDSYKGDVREVTMPEERFGLLYVFRVFERVSYALIMEAARPVTIGDKVRNP